MKSNYYLLIGIILFSLFSSTSCNNQSLGDGTLTTIKKDDNALTICHLNNIKDTVEIKLSNLVKDFKVVRFENSNEAFFKMGAGPTITDNYIGIRQSRGPFLLFNHSGKLLCEVGGIGGGPGEYTSLYDEAINEKLGKIYLAPFYASSKVLEYNTDGSFIRDILIKSRLNKPKIDVDDNGNISIIHMPFESNEDRFLALQYNKDGTLIHQLKPLDYLIVKDINKNGVTIGYNNEIFSYRNTSNFDFMITSCDTLFHYNKENNKLYPKFTVDFGRKEDLPMHIYNEIPDFYLAYVAKSGVIAVNKKKQTSSYIKIINDLFGHMTAPAFNFNKGWFFQMFEPDQLIEKIEKRLAQKDCSLEDRKQLEEMLNSLDENDNNVLFIAKLK